MPLNHAATRGSCESPGQTPPPPEQSSQTTREDITFYTQLPVFPPSPQFNLIQYSSAPAPGHTRAAGDEPAAGMVGSLQPSRAQTGPRTAQQCHDTRLLRTPTSQRCFPIWSVLKPPCLHPGLPEDSETPDPGTPLPASIASRPCSELRPSPPLSVQHHRFFSFSTGSFPSAHKLLSFLLAYKKKHTHSAIHPSRLSSYTPFLKPRALRSAPLTSAPWAQLQLRPLQTGSLLHFAMPATLAKVSCNPPDPPFSGHTV